MTLDILWFLGGYILILIALGYRSYRARGASDLADFYLGGRSFTFVFLLFTLFATQYSGNTLLGFSGKAYRMGLHWMVCIQFMMAIVVFYHLLAPRLYKLSHQHAFITPSDYLDYRYGSRLLSVMAALLLIFALSNYLLSQLMALGRTVAGLFSNTDLNQYDLYLWGIIVFSILMALYETLGGLRAVVWTDALQGVLLFSGFIVLFIILLYETGGLAGIDKALELDGKPDRLAAPTGPGIAEWFSYIILVGIGGALYPQAIQRIYAAKTEASLRLSFRFMAFMPIVTSGVAMVIGLSALILFPGLTGAEADRALPLLLEHLYGITFFYRIVVLLIFTAIVAAIMSTADSVLLSISSIFVNDVIRPFYKFKNEQLLTKYGKVFSWLLLGLCVWLASALRDTTIVKLMDKKFDILVQLSPAFILGLHLTNLRLGAVLGGLLGGLVVVLAMSVTGHNKLYGMHAGLYGLCLNLALVGMIQYRAQRTKNPA